MATSTLAAVLANRQSEILEDWLRLQSAGGLVRSHLVAEAELREQCREFLERLTRASAMSVEAQTAEYDQVRAHLGEISRMRARLGFSPTETATFVFSLKQPLFAALRADARGDALAEELWRATLLVDALGLHIVESFQRTREEIILRQQQEMMELSTPVVKLWDGILALPIIGTLDSARTQVIMENLLQRIVDTGASLAIIDITGVPTVDTLVAQHLLKTVSAARLMGADCIVSGIRPQIAQTIVHLGVALGDVITRATLADAFQLALARTNQTVVKIASKSAN